MIHDLVESTADSAGISGVTQTLPRPTKTVLLAEDDENDAFIMKLACESTGLPCQLQVVTDGPMAIDYIFGNGCYADRTLYPMPDVVFLDINMPRQNGFEVLKLIRARPALKKLPVIMLSSSTRMTDVDRACQLGVTSYLQKVPSQVEFRQAIEVILKNCLHLQELHP